MASLILRFVPDEVEFAICVAIVGRGACTAAEIMSKVLDTLIAILTMFNIAPCGSLRDCANAFINLVSLATMDVYRQFGPMAGDEFAYSVLQLLRESNRVGLLRLIETTGQLWGLISWMREQNRNLERGFGVIVVAARTLLRGGAGWIWNGFVSQSYRYGTWWASVFIYSPPVLSHDQGLKGLLRCSTRCSHLLGVLIHLLLSLGQIVMARSGMHALGAPWPVGR